VWLCCSCLKRGTAGQGRAGPAAAPAPAACRLPPATRTEACCLYPPPPHPSPPPSHPQLDDQEAPRYQEAAFDLRKRLRQELAAPAVIHFYCGLLRGYRGNGARLNHALCSLLWRLLLPDQLDLAPLLYQLSVLRVLHTVGGSGGGLHRAG
jgi:hypothetical protein